MSTSIGINGPQMMGQEVRNDTKSEYNPMRRDSKMSCYGTTTPTTSNSGNCGGDENGGGGALAAFPPLPTLKTGVPSGFASVQLLPDFPTFSDFNPYLESTISQVQFQVK